MTISWQSFLGEHRTSAADSDSALIDLSSHGTVVISGADAESFLQGQFTNDVSRCTEHRAQLGAWCSPKGRVLLSFWMLRRADVFYLLTPTPVDAKLITRLKMFVMRAKVDITHDTEANIRIGCTGGAAQECLQTLYGKLPEASGDVVHNDDNTSVMKTHGEDARFELVGPLGSMQSLWQQLSAVCAVGALAGWTSADLRAGLPLIQANTADEYLPQMLNLEELGAIDYEKGCYVGQEVIARLHYRGTVKRKLYIATSTSPLPISSGAEVLSTLDGDAHPAGKVLAVEATDAGGSIVQAVLNINDVENGTLSLHDGTKLSLEGANRPTEAAESV